MEYTKKIADAEMNAGHPCAGQILPVAACLVETRFIASNRVAARSRMNAGHPSNGQKSYQLQPVW
jgi:hypothetical protein